MTEKQREELAQRVIDCLRKEWGDEFADEDTIRIHNFIMDEADPEIPYPASEADIINAAMEFEMRYG